jgi:NADH:ubiquinone oxidoreductase subunit C
MTDSANRLAELARELLGDKVSECIVDRGEVTLVIPRDRLVDACVQLRDAGGLGFEELIDLCGIDYAEYGVDEWNTDAAPDTGFSRGVSRDAASHAGTAHPHRFAAVYQLLSVSNNQPTGSASSSRDTPTCAVSSPTTASSAIRSARTSRSVAISRCATTRARAAPSTSR